LGETNVAETAGADGVAGVVACVVVDDAVGTIVDVGGDVVVDDTDEFTVVLAGCADLLELEQLASARTPITPIAMEPNDCAHNRFMGAALSSK
jgi:hypothetical protein